MSKMEKSKKSAKVDQHETAEPDVTIGVVVGAFGVRGELKVRVETDFPERFEHLQEIWLKPRGSDGRMVKVERSKLTARGAVVKIEGCDDRDSAELLRDAEFRISRVERMELEPGRYYVSDIVGLQVYTTAGEYIGCVTDVLQYPANDVYETERGLIPATKQVVKEIDLDSRKMIIEPLDGMFE